jgi:predicted metalloprotease with PDZ domain
MRLAGIFALLAAGLLLFSNSARARPITLDVDASQAPQKLLHAKLVIPAPPGMLALFYPKWPPGTHGPFGAIVDVAGPIITAGGKRLSWWRDPVDAYAIYCDVPPESDAVEVTFDYLISSESTAFSGGNSTAKLAVINWDQVLFYPSGGKPEELIYSATIRLPEGWRFGTSLPVAKQSGATIKFEPVSLYTLVDSPVNAGQFFRRIPLASNIQPEHELDIVADSEEALDVPEILVSKYSRLIEEAASLFGNHPYGRYRFLVTLSDQISHWGLEHHESSETKLPEEFFTGDDAHRMASLLVLPHELAHSWNGKYRRPAEMVGADYQQAEKTNLLWVYEGLTEYIAYMLAGRAGLLTAEEERESIAWIAAALDQPRPGRNWRTLADTATAAQLALYPGYSEWVGWRRKLDFYWEGPLIWLEADVHIRQQTAGQKSLDDFLRDFFGKPRGAVVVPFTIDDLVASINRVAPWDWKTFFSTRVDQITRHPPMGGIEGAGWKIEYSEEANQWDTSLSQIQQRVFLLDTLGFSVSNDGIVIDTVPDMPAVKAGVGPGMKVLAVNGRLWSPARIRAAVKRSKTAQEPIALLLQNGDYVDTYKIDYHGGEKQPHMVRDDTKPDLFLDIFASRADATRSMR